MSPFKVKYSYLCQILWENNYANKAEKPDLLVQKLKSIYEFTEAEEKCLRRQIVTIFLTQFTKKWNSVSRKKDTFKSRYADFLQKDFIVNFEELESTNPNLSQNRKLNESADGLITEGRVGRPRLSFEEGSDKTKLRRAKELASKHTYEELRLAVAIKEKEFSADSDDSNDSEAEPEKSNLSEYERNEILAMFMDGRFSKQTYTKIRAHNLKMFGSKLYPPYYEIVSAKQDCYPDNIEITDLGVKVHLISLLECTVRRILTIVDETEVQNLQGKKLTFLGKWGMDGASGQQTTRQSWTSETNASFNHSIQINDDIMADPSDEAVFITCFVPLQLRVGDKILWTNKKPNSVLYCRPINFQFIKETNKLIKENYRYYSEILDKIETFCLDFKDIKFDMKCTMLDGKACNAITDQRSSASCNICGATPSNMNNIAMVLSLPSKEKFYKLGFPVLHSWIRFMEYVLHIAYNLDFKKGVARGNDKELKKARKKEIQKSLKNELQLSVDIVKQGSGTTNTGNVGRAFFQQAERVSELIGVDKDLLVRMHAILQIISCGQETDLVRFEEYCINTARKCAELYSWYKMPPSVHKVLIHGCDIMKALNAPMIWFSEEPQECHNKVFRKARSEHSRMYQRSNTNKDIIHYALVSSDPVIGSLREIEQKKIQELTSEAEQFLTGKNKNCN